MAEPLFANVGEFVASLTGVASRADEAVRLAVAEAAHLIEAGAKVRSPVRTGTLRRSISVFGPTTVGIGRYEALIGPSVIYGRRVELGFVGPDRLGRNYSQAGQPYLSPALEASGAAIEAIFMRRLGAVTGGR